MDCLDLLKVFYKTHYTVTNDNYIRYLTYLNTKNPTVILGKITCMQSRWGTF